MHRRANMHNGTRHIHTWSYVICTHTHTYTHMHTGIPTLESYAINLHLFRLETPVITKITVSAHGQTYPGVCVVPAVART